MFLVHVTNTPRLVFTQLWCGKLYLFTLSGVKTLSTRMFFTRSKSINAAMLCGNTQLEVKSPEFKMLNDKSRKYKCLKIAELQARVALC